MKLSLERLKNQYNLWKLVCFKEIINFSHCSKHIICDIDKTYLETEFDSLIKIAKIAVEKPYDKKTVPGAADVLKSFQHTFDKKDRALHFVSSSPYQMRPVLTKKFKIDGLTWNSDTFKNQSYNLKTGNFGKLRRQIPYKSAAILNLMSLSKANSQFFMVGDNAESDSIIYLGIKHFVEKRLSIKGYIKYLEIFGVERSLSVQLIRRIKTPSLQVPQIFIRNISQQPVIYSPLLADSISNFDHFHQVYQWLHTHHIIDQEAYNKSSFYLHSQASTRTSTNIKGHNFSEEDILLLAKKWSKIIKALKRYS